MFHTDSVWHPTALFEIFEIFFLFEERTRLFHLSGLLCGVVMLLWERSRRFPGSGIKLTAAAVGDRTSTVESLGRHRDSVERRSNWTRSWGYADVPSAATVVRQRTDEERTSVDRGYSGQWWRLYICQHFFASCTFLKSQRMDFVSPEHEEKLAACIRP